MSGDEVVKAITLFSCFPTCSSDKPTFVRTGALFKLL